MIWGAIKRTAISEWTATALVLSAVYALTRLNPVATARIPDWAIVGAGVVLALTVYRVLFVRRRR